MNRGLVFLKTASKKVVHKTGEFLVDKIADKIVKEKYFIDKNPRNDEEIIIPPEKWKRRNVKWIETSIKQFNCVEICDK